MIRVGIGMAWHGTDIYVDIDSKKRKESDHPTANTIYRSRGLAVP